MGWVAKIRRDELKCGMKVCGYYDSGRKWMSGIVTKIDIENDDIHVTRTDGSDAFGWHLRLGNDGYWLAAHDSAKEGDYLFLDVGSNDMKLRVAEEQEISKMRAESTEKLMTATQVWAREAEIDYEQRYAEIFKGLSVPLGPIWTIGHDVGFSESVTVKTGILSAIGLGKETKVNKVIAEVYEKTKDAVLVNEFFRDEIPASFSGKMLLQANKDEYLAEAKRRKEEQKAK